MSTRWYPIYQRGNPQLRVFLPNFWMKLVRPEYEQPKNVVRFICSMRMTKYDAANYLKSIYNVPVVSVRMRIALGETYTDPFKNYVKKKDDYRIAYVVLPKDMEFEYPDISQKEEREKEEREDIKSMDEMKSQFKKYIDRNKDRKGLPAWFSI